MSSFLLTILGTIISLSSLTNAQSCDTYTTQFDCDTDAACTWLDSSDLCMCASEVKLDILWNIDTSGSIGWSNFQVMKNFTKKMVTQGIGNTSQIGFFMFSTTVNRSKVIQHWEYDDLLEYVEGLYWTRYYTNTGQVLNDSLNEFERAYDPERQQVLLLMTDGIPCVQYNCPHSVCGYASDFLDAGIRVIVIAVGDFETAYVECLVQDDDDFIVVADFDEDDFDSIMGTLTDITCPVTKTAKFTEIKAEKKESTWNNRWSRFVEIYNSGVDFDLDDIKLEGLVSMDRGAFPHNVTIEQGDYVVFYDAADNSLVSGNSTVSCHLCGATCDLESCPNTTIGDSTLGSAYCWCGKAVYVACRNTADECPADLPKGNSDAVINGCSACTFDDSMDRENWYVQLGDSGSDLIDTVTYNASDPNWDVTWDGYSYELYSKSWDNDDPANWYVSCSVLGTPGSDPLEGCTEECNVNEGCGDGGECNTDTSLCDCDNGYYPKCTSVNSCTSCAEVPEVSECIVYWRKNLTVNTGAYEYYAFYIWEAADTDLSAEYRLTYYANSKNGDTSDVTSPDNFYRTNDYWPLNDTFGGYVETALYICTNTSADSTQQDCNWYYSSKTPCVVVTQSPTSSPSPAPTEDPTADPTSNPTPSPTWPCPTFWWTSDDVCDPDRCNCNGRVDECCLDDPDFDVTYDSNRAHDDSYACKLDSDLVYPLKRDDGVDEAQLSSGYLLSEGDHNFLIDIDPDNYPYTMDIEWELQFDTITCSYDENGNNTENDCETDDVSVAGLSVSPQRGNLTIWGEQDARNATMSFKVTELSCDDVDVDDENSTDDTTTRRRGRRLLDDQSCFESTAVFGNLVITNASSRGQPECGDGRIYPMRIPVWFNYDEAFVSVPTDTETLPGWLWWFIAALGVFLAILAVLVYWYWYKSKRTGAAFQETQAQLDAEVEINENGWQSGLNPNAVGFNPLATGFNPNAPAGGADPNAPLNGGGGQQDFVRANVEKTVFREEYGPNAGNLR